MNLTGTHISAHVRPVMKCGHCGDVIGIYEPVVLLRDGQARTTSAAAEPQVGDEPGEHFHRTCYAESSAVLAAP
jgi:hypothetical protein